MADRHPSELTQFSHSSKKNTLNVPLAVLMQT